MLQMDVTIKNGQACVRAHRAVDQRLLQASVLILEEEEDFFNWSVSTAVVVPFGSDFSAL